MAFTLQALNRRLAPFGVIAYKSRNVGGSYIYFEATRGTTIPSVFVHQLDALTIEQWIEHVREHLPTAPSVPAIDLDHMLCITIESPHRVEADEVALDAIQTLTKRGWKVEANAFTETSHKIWMDRK